MGMGRQARESEKCFEKVWDEIKHLCVCVWRGEHLLENAEEHVESIKRNLDKTIELMRDENNSSPILSLQQAN